MKIFPKKRDLGVHKILFCAVALFAVIGLFFYGCKNEPDNASGAQAGEAQTGTQKEQPKEEPPENTPSGIVVNIYDLRADGHLYQTTTELYFYIDSNDGDEIADLTADDIELGGIDGVIKGTLRNDYNNNSYILPISGFKSSGSLSFSISKTGYIFGNSPLPVYIFKYSYVTFSTLTANGSETQTTTELMLTFDQEIFGLTADDINITYNNVKKGTLSRAFSDSGSTYILQISGFTYGFKLYVSVNKSDYNIYDSQKNVEVYYYTPPSVGIVISLTDNKEWELTEQTAHVIPNVDKTFTVAETYTARWYLDGAFMGTGQSYTFNKPAGVYQLFVAVTDTNGESRSGRCRITVRQQLTEGVFVEGKITVTSTKIDNYSYDDDGYCWYYEGYIGEDWYSFPVTQGTQYYIDYEGLQKIILKYENGTDFFNLDYSSYDLSNSSAYFIADQTGTVWIKVGCVSSSPADVVNYNIAYSTTNFRAKKYDIVFEDRYKNIPNQTIYAGSSIVLPDMIGLSPYGETFYGWTNLKTGITYTAGSLYTPTDEDLYYGLVRLSAKWVSKAFGSRSNPFLLIADTWTTGNCDQYFSFNVTSGTSYTVTSQTYTYMDNTIIIDHFFIKISAFYDDYNSGIVIFDYNSKWGSFTATKDGKVIIKVENAQTGTFDIKYYQE